MDSQLRAGAILGKDEMNLAELPFFLLSTRSPKNVNEISFTYEEKHRGETVRTRLEIKGDPKLGLPTSREEELVLACLQISKTYNDYIDPKVHCTQSQLLRELGWGSRGAAYKRLEESFFRISETRYRVDGWRDNEKKIHTKKGSFSLISDFLLQDSRRKGSTDRIEGEEEPPSYFVWGRTIFDSFRSGYLKELDYELVRSFKKSATKRLYRYLDKHFNPPHYVKVVRKLKPFAHDRMAISASADLTEIRRVLEPATKELEEAGFLVASRWKERITKVQGEWQIEFVRRNDAPITVTTNKASVGASAHGGNHYETELIKRGVDRQVAESIVGRLVETTENVKFSHRRLRYVVELFDFKKRSGKKCGPGFIVEGIRRDAPYPPDKGFRPSGELHSNRKFQRRDAAQSKKSSSHEKAVKERVAKLTEAESESMISLALKQKGKYVADTYARFQKEDTEKFQELRQFLLEEHVQELLRKSVNRSCSTSNEQKTK